MADNDKIVPFLDQLIEDTSVPRNVRAAIQRAKDRLLKDEGQVGVSGAVYALEEVSNDINLPMHARTMIWSLLSELESMKN